jgi:rhodanese-related sulfurtransferase
MMSHKWYWLLVLVMAVALLAACGSDDPEETANTSDQTEASYKTLTIDEFAEIVENKSDEYMIVNVHIPYEGEVENTDSHVAYNDLDALTSALPDKNAPIVLYCRSGNMSNQAAHQLVEMGYTNLYDVPGGMIDWAASGRSVIEK